ncbi:uncharacterized protein GIQ15_04158 [Arthroderma uncinatum]|uniref:uncharacterized protein n=1 Tax=Arthroderma uncinatum TaxID=74035 RepID=UPI00144ADA77|nr:uncharacterized protein GIQ15_04158 [Arthroderma uncinatum]KAF3481399.1 hypothetical protein GIQ15_04158 [Arthroderma uncinatum]
MNTTSIRSSEYSYRDPRYFSSSSIGNVPHSKGLVDGYGGMMHSTDDEGSRYNPQLTSSLSQGSVLLNANDPVAMHLLAETAIGDSLHFEVLSYEEVEDLKRELSLVLTRIEGGKRKLALELKLQEAAQSLNRLYDDGPDMVNGNRKRTGHLGMNGGAELSHTSDEGLAMTMRKCEEQSQEIAKLERRASDIRTRILEHTAGVLQMTHKGLKKKKGAKTDESSTNEEDPYGCGHEFDHRSLYRTADYLDHHGGGGPRDVPSLEPDVESTSTDLSGLQNTQSKLEEMNYRLREMILQMSPDQDVDPIPQIISNGATSDPLATVNIQLEYLEKGLESIALHRSYSSQDSQEPPPSAHNTIDKLDEFSRRLDEALAAAGSSRQPTSPHISVIRKTLPEQLDYLETAVVDVEKRIESFIEQKTILSTQIQQQRDLNSKSDAERDSYIADLTADIAKLRKELDKSNAEAEGARTELAMVMDQLDSSRQDSMLREQKRSIGEAPQPSPEKDALLKAEQTLADKEARIDSLESTLQELRSQTDIQLHEAHQSREQAEQAHSKLQSEFAELESEMVRIQTELTFAKAELDGAYGSRSERAAEAAANPAVQREIDDLRERNMDLTSQIATLKSVQMNNANSASTGAHERIQMLEKELRETIDDYEELTKQSIEFEKERDKFENMIDGYRDRCDTLETQLSDERIQNLGVRDGLTVENTSITVLKNEFKKMMRETRAESIKTLKEPFSGLNHGFDRTPARHIAYSVDRPSGLRRVVSTRTLSPHLDSSESLPSEHSSLYDAFLSSYESEHNTAQPSPKKEDESTEPAGSSHVHEIRSWDVERTRRQERLAVPSLETILEHQSVSTHGATSSRSRLRPCASVGVSSLSKSSYSRASSVTPPIRWNRYGSKIYSFDDHDLPSFQPKFSFSSLPSERRHSCSTLSSDGSFETPSWLNDVVSPAAPTQPIHPPPHRPSTPPGVPSFGSPEALNYDISSLPRGTPRTDQNGSRSSPQINQDPGTGAANDSSNEASGCCGLDWRRLFRETASYITYQPPERLPPGVLARADDGTLVRGRFGARASGHGIGATSSLENHPFHQNNLPAARTKDANVQAPQPAHTRSSRSHAVNDFGLQRHSPRPSSTSSSNPLPRYRSLLDDHRDLPAPSTPPEIPQPGLEMNVNTTSAVYYGFGIWFHLTYPSAADWAMTTNTRESMV